MKSNWSQEKKLKAYRFAAEKHTNEYKGKGRYQIWVTSTEGQRDMEEAFDTSEKLINYLREKRSIDIESLNTPFNL